MSRYGWMTGPLIAATLLVGCDARQDEDAPSSADPQAADLILTNGAVYTLNPRAPWAEAVAIGGGRILAVGATDRIAARYRGETLDLKGQMLLPGFHDAHSHPVAGGVMTQQCDLTGAASVAAVVERVAACDAALPAGDWLLGGGWDLSLFPAANPHKALLDRIARERPMYLEGADGHSGWVNSRALELAGVSADRADPPLGRIERDARGEPSGTLRESARDLVRAVVPPVTEAQWDAGALAGITHANRLGITSLVEAAVERPALDALRRLERAGRLTARVVASVHLAGGDPDAAASIAPGDRGSTARLRVDAAKLFIDGVLEGETAALLEPYLDGTGRPKPGRAGTLNLPEQRLAELVTELDARGVQVHMHAIGDRAVRAGLDAVAAARAANGPRDNRHHIAHLQLVHARDHHRFAQLGVLANFQALWAFPDRYITEVNRPAVGDDRVRRMYPIGSMLKAGARLVGGSDWTVSSMNPLQAIEVAVTRQDPAGEIDGVLNPREAVPLAVMLAAYTVNGAYLMHQEADTGSIEPGKRADLVVLARNLFEVPDRAIGEVAITRTFFEGRTVHVAPEPIP